MRKVVLFLIILISFASLKGQSVGLVLSGGGAKGMAHIGVIRALEESGIPINYITGTSIGAIIGSLYAMGYSPDEMKDLISSDEFKKWYSGEQDMSYQYFFRKKDPKPVIISVALSDKDSITIIRPLNISVVDPIQMNLAFLDIYAGATATCEGDFDSLFVPFRTVASDVFNKKQIVLREGDLGDAVRVSMSFPFVFKPIKIDSIIAYDGGIYNNFPLDIMIKEFNPDFVIGSVASIDSYEIPDDNDLMGQIRGMITQKSNYDLPDSLGVKIEFDIKNVGLLDFYKINDVHNLAYTTTLQLIDSIKKRVDARVDISVVREKRRAFKQRIPSMIFKEIEIEGVKNEQQSEFVRREFQEDKEDTFDFETLKRGYFRLLSDTGLKEIIPKATFNRVDSTYTLNLKVNFDDNPIISLGGGISSSSTTQIYTSMSYKTVRNLSSEFFIEGQLGKAYNNAQFSSFFDLPTKVPSALSFILSYSNINYYKPNYFFENSERPAFNKEIEFFTKIKTTYPFRNNYKAEFTVGASKHKDYYLQSTIVNFDNFKYDVSHYKILGGSVKFFGSTLNRLQYATKGRSETLIAQIYTANETFVSKGIIDKSFFENQSWLQMSFTFEQYSNISKKVVLGEYFKIYYSSRNRSNNYYATMMQAGRFEPTVNSQFTYNTKFRSNEYIITGLRSLYLLNSFIHLRKELYMFLPIRPILKDKFNNAYLGDLFTKPAFMVELSAVAQYGKISCNTFVNVYSSQWDNITFGITIGLLMLNERFIE